MSKNTAGQRAQNWAPTRPRLPRLVVIIGLALLAWGAVIVFGMLGWSAISGLLGL
jgi:hypothetical protein